MFVCYCVSSSFPDETSPNSQIKEHHLRGAQKGFVLKHSPMPRRVSSIKFPLSLTLYVYLQIRIFVFFTASHKIYGVHFITLQELPVWMLARLNRWRWWLSTPIPMAKNDSRQFGVSWNCPGDVKTCYWNAAKMHLGARLRVSSRDES